MFDKPLIYSISEFDTSVYDADWLDEPKWSIQILPKIGTELKREMLSNIEGIINETLKSETKKAGRNEVRSKAWANIAESAERAVDWLIEKEAKL